MKFITILLMILPIMLAAAEEVKLPSSVERVLSKHEKAVNKAQKEYLEAMQDIVADSVKALKKEQEKVVKSGDLEMAMAVKAKIDEIGATDVTEGLKIDLFGEKKEKKVNGKMFVVKSDSTDGVSFTIPKGKSLTIKVDLEGKWSANGAKDRESDYKGLSIMDGDFNKMAMLVVSDDKTEAVLDGMTLEEGSYTIKCNDGTPDNNSGEIAITLIP